MKLSSLFLFSSVLCSTVLPAVQAQEFLRPETPVEEIRLRPGQLPAVKLTGELLYRVLSAEIAAHRGHFDMASGWFFGLARDTSDPRLAQKAFQASVLARNMERAQRAAQQWVLLAPDDEEAVASAMALAASNGRTSGMAGALRARIERAENAELAIMQAAAIVSKLNDKQAALSVLDQTLTEEMRELPVAHLALSDAAWAAGQAARALQEARHALQLDPNLEGAAQRMLEYGLGVDPAQAIEQARAFLVRHPNADKLAMQLASHLARQGRVDEALTLVGQLQQRAPEDFDLMRVEAELNLQAGRLARAKELLHAYIQVQTQRRAAVNDQSSSAASDASDARLLLVQIAEKEGNVHDAIEQLDLVEDPTLVFQAQIHKAVLHGQLGNLAEALRTLDALQPRSDEEQAVLMLTQASIYRDAGRSEQAVELLEKGDRRLPDTIEIKYDLGMMYERQGRFEDFERMMREIIALDAEHANALNSLGYTFADQNVRLPEAGQLLERALQLEPDNPYILDSIGWYYYRVGDLATALRYLERSYQLLPAADVAAHLGEVLWKQGRRDEAKRIWREALAKEPENDVVLRTLRRLEVKL
ncbi:tetratricopeptide repeat protein [Pusillimonas sp. CC-YST705]|uniref:Tetratricopeptide repeat protein n=1 Tax=Mesopusillimonas faecipullorum TaxID=2755040 RepID=A0ABS8CBS7_9BURK|nr:tetratricopeptide repeat protein [Mesopusillimonas faecipullorum]MCB5363481.1 tetratricopeptide repeat protein [Mesopusillimonas faecipullorum]